MDIYEIFGYLDIFFCTCMGTNKHPKKNIFSFLSVLVLVLFLWLWERFDQPVPVARTGFTADMTLDFCESQSFSVCFPTFKPIQQLEGLPILPMDIPYLMGSRAT